MKASELMLNDWVQHKGTPYRVCMITDIGVVTADDGICHFHFISKYLDPIPLTENILVKNGFKKESQTIDGDYCKYILPGFALNWCDTDGFWYQNGDITPNYVHQLQHLLRLVGVQKDIEL